MKKGVFPKFAKTKFSPSIKSPFSQVYCQGDLLHTVQMSHIFDDSKTFVDMQIKTTPDEVMASFAEFMTSHNQDPSANAVKDWVAQNFNNTGSEFEDWIPQDHQNELNITKRISDGNFKKFILDLNQVWLELGRKMKQDVAVSGKFWGWYLKGILINVNFRTIQIATQSFM